MFLLMSVEHPCQQDVVLPSQLILKDMKRGSVGLSTVPQ